MNPPAAADLELAPREARERQRAGAVLIDVREPGEWALGSPLDAERIPLQSVVEQVAATLAADAEVLTICGSGKRSLQAATALRARGYVRARSVSGGFARWQAEGLPAEHVSALDADARERYARHLVLPEIGEVGQQRLEASRVLLVGAGGLGSPAAFYLAAAGVGRLRIVDHDRIDRSNLQRQILHRDADLGGAKVESAARALTALNPRVRVEAVAERVVAANVEALLGGADVVIDGTDNFAARYLLNDACVKLGKPLVYGAVHRFEGQVGVFWPAHPRGDAPCYRCLFPEPPPPDAAPNCAEAGVLGVVPGIVGLLQAGEALKLLLGVGEPLLGRLLNVDALGARFREIRLRRDPACPACGGAPPALADLPAICTAP
jgi:molybdopterin/thiamine biosynthesis adenylyltransferase/rhodanese-related sulfurtransferase